MVPPAGHQVGRGCRGWQPAWTRALGRLGGTVAETPPDPSRVCVWEWVCVLASPVLCECAMKKKRSKKGSLVLGVCPLLHALPLAPLWCLSQCASSQGHSLSAGKATRLLPLQPSSPRASFPPRHLVAARGRCVGQWHTFGNIPVAFCLHDVINKKRNTPTKQEKRVSPRVTDMAKQTKHFPLFDVHASHATVDYKAA
jgi:hypothetical protein